MEGSLLTNRDLQPARYRTRLAHDGQEVTLTEQYTILCIFKVYKIYHLSTRCNFVLDN